VKSFRSGPTTPFAAGLITIVVVVLAVYVAFGGHLPWQHPFELRAVVQNATELQSRSPVRVAGVNVGKVSDVERGPGHTAVVTMQIDKGGLPIHRDATLKVRPRIFLEGNFFVDLSPGTPSAPNLHSGDTLPLAQTAVPVQFDQILSSLQSSTREDLKQVVHTFAETLEGGGARAFHQMLPDWAPAFLNLAQFQEAVRGEGPHDLSQFIQSAEKVSGALASQDRSLRDLVTGLNRTLRATNDRRAQLAASVTGLNRLVDVANPAFAALNRAFPPTRAFVREARPGIEAAPATLRQANPLLAQLTGLLSKPELPALLAQLDPALASLSKLEPQLQDILGRVTPVTECLRTDALPTLETPVEDPPLTTGDPPYRELLHALVGLSSASQNFTGDGPAVRYHAGFGDRTLSTGNIPSVGDSLVGLTSEPLIGSRPRYTGVKPPFRPDVPCVTQKRPDLHAETGPAEQTRQLP
jgi:phospholipid/cholesterol/gamma-HCH transport system substrate-binding protein